VKVISEKEFSERVRLVLEDCNECGCVTGPGRSGAVASVYASHILHIPFIPYGSKPPIHLGRLLIIDTAEESGSTMRKAGRRYSFADPKMVTCYKEPPRVMFWYESGKPQMYKHQSVAA